MRARAVLFDKDGTLFDFQKTWSRWIADEIGRFSKGDAVLASDIAAAIGFDLKSTLILPESPAIAGTSEEVAQILLPFSESRSVTELQRELDEKAAKLVPVEVLPLIPFTDELLAMGMVLGVATNDNEAAARQHLRTHAIEGKFSYIAGYDSGYGAKPGPGMCEEFLRFSKVEAIDAIMVGDSLHDLHAGRAAGMQTVAVLTGVAVEEDLRDHADIVMPDIGHLAQWIKG